MKKMNRMDRMNKRSYGATDTGKKRKGNEDSYRLLPEKDVYIVADGMGGHNAGEVASLKTVNIVDEYLTPERILKMKANQVRGMAEEVKAEPVKIELENAIYKAHKGILAMSQTNREYAGMGSTIVLTFIHNNVLQSCHVGDSRIYVINQSGITRITNDHSQVAELVQMGEMTKEEARHSPLKSRITQALGSSFPINPEYNP